MTQFLPLIKFFDKAATHLQRPKILLQMQTRAILLKRTAQGQRPGVVYVIPASDNGWLGYVNREGFWAKNYKGEFTDELHEEIQQTLLEFQSNPAAIAAIYGKKKGQCCFCRAELTDPRSVSVGYGPICADHYDLPWSEQLVSVDPKELEGALK
jgi:hypothetical protein